METLELNLDNDGMKGIDFIRDGNEMNIFVAMDNDNENFTPKHMRRLYDFLGLYLKEVEEVIVALDSGYGTTHGEILFTGTLEQCLGYKFDGRHVVMFRGVEMIYWSEGWEWIKNE